MNANAQLRSGNASVLYGKKEADMRFKITYSERHLMPEHIRQRAKEEGVSPEALIARLVREYAKKETEKMEYYLANPPKDEEEDC
jgi:hypothetical protein